MTPEKNANKTARNKLESGEENGVVEHGFRVFPRRWWRRCALKRRDPRALAGAQEPDGGPPRGHPLQAGQRGEPLRVGGRPLRAPGHTLPGRILQGRLIWTSSSEIPSLPVAVTVKLGFLSDTLQSADYWQAVSVRGPIIFSYGRFLIALWNVLVPQWFILLRDAAITASKNVTMIMLLKPSVLSYP